MVAFMLFTGSQEQDPGLLKQHADKAYSLELKKNQLSMVYYPLKDLLDKLLWNEPGSIIEF